ncbi:type II secretion system F family protein [Candidatus Parcubacteria bacterium]|nr:type II secretion system F family protein [Candidatus Parcubacteria bacterium]
MKFSYTAKKADESTYDGVFIAESKTDLFTKIKQTGDVLVSYKIVTDDKFQVAWEKFASSFSKVKMIDKIIFARNLANMLEAGLSLTRSIAVMEKQSKNKKLKNIYHELNLDISAGKTFHDALDRWNTVFPPVFISMVKAGEESGNLADSLKSVGTQMEATYKLQKKIKGAMMYPSVIFVVMIIIGLIMMVFVVPKLTATFADVKAELPGSTKFVIFMSEFLRNHFILLPLMLLAAMTAIYQVLHTKQGRKIFDRIVIKLPIFGQLIKESNSAKTARTLSSLIGSGVDLIQSVDITSEVLQNNLYKDVMSQVKANVEKGKPMSDIFNQHEELYPVFVSEMINVGEETGKLATMLQGVAVFYENEVDQKTKDLSTIIEPILMVFIGGAVGFFAISMITPMYSVMNNI